jgi:ABC-type transport system substrate-binding protein
MTMHTRRDLVAGMVAAGALLGGASLLSGCGTIKQIISRSVERNSDRLGDASDGRADGSAPDGSAADSRTGGTLYVASRWPAAIEPLYLQELFGIQIASCLFDPLVRYDHRTGTLVGAAAKSWEANEDGTVFTFTLVEDARFHNGDAVTAADFKYSWERLLKPDTLGPPSDNASYIAMIEGAEALMAGEADEATGIRAIDRLTLEVTLSAPFHDFPQVLTYPALAPVPSSSAVEDAEEFALLPVGNGPFMVQDYESWEDDALKLTRFDDYHGEPALPAALWFVFFEDDWAEDAEPYGEDGMWAVAQRPLRKASGRPGLRQAAAGRLGLRQAAAGRLGSRTAAASRLGLRTAAGRPGQAAATAPSPHRLIVPGPSKAADSQLMTYEMKAYEGFAYGELDLAPVPVEEFEDALFSYGEAADGYTAAPGSQTLAGAEAYTQFLWLNFEHEPLTDARVRQALSYAIDRDALCKELYLDTCSSASGIIPPGIEGFRDGAWPAATFSISRAKQALADAGYPEGEGLAPLTLVVSDTESDRRLFEMIETDLKAAGFKVKTSVVTGAERFWSTLEGSAALALTGWIADFPLMESFLTSLFAGFGSYNQFGYDNPAVDEGIIAARAIADEKERLAAFQAVDDLVAADMPVIPLFFMRHSLVCSDRVNDLYVAPDGLADLPRAWVSL